MFCQRLYKKSKVSHLDFFKKLSVLRDLNSTTTSDKNIKSNEKLSKDLVDTVKDEPDCKETIKSIISKGSITNKNMSIYTSLKKYNDTEDKIPQLAHGLDKTLFSPGVHYMKDPRINKAYQTNFHSSLLKIPHIDNLKMDKIGSFTPSSRDTKLLDIALENNVKLPENSKVKFYSSTSSMTNILSKFHSLLSNNRPVNTSNFSKFFPVSVPISSSSTVASSSVVTPKSKEHGIYSIDADRTMDSEITLSVLGNALELMLTKETGIFKSYLKGSDLEPEVDKSAYHYAKIGNFLIRSQLDARNGNLPGTGTFDIKTRAVCSIRFDILHTDYFPTNYEICKTYGLFESFERELFDAARIVMMKYSLQARLGNMDGIFMAFHNIKKFLGFQYLTLTEIDNLFFGDFDINNTYGKPLLPKESSEEDQMALKNIVNDIGNQWQTKREVLSTFMADHELKTSFTLLEKLMEDIVKDTKGEPFRMMMKKVSSLPGVEIEKGKKDTKLIIMVNTLEQEELSEMQKLANEKYEQNKEEVISVQSEDQDEIKISEKIKRWASMKSKGKQEYFAMNRKILSKSLKKNGFFVYTLKIQHLFNGIECTKRYPTPSVEILDPKNNYRWDVEYEIEKVDSLTTKKLIYDKFTKNVTFNVFRVAEGDETNDVYSDEDCVQLDENATELQNVVRAYSVRATKRAKMKHKKS